MGNCATRPKVLKGGSKRGAPVPAKKPAPETEPITAAAKATEVGSVEKGECGVIKSVDLVVGEKTDEEGTGRKSLSNLLKKKEVESTNGDKLLEPVKPEVMEPMKTVSSEPMKLDVGQPMKLKSSELVKLEAAVPVNEDLEAAKAESFEPLELKPARQELMKTEEPTTNISETKQPETDKPSAPTEPSTSKFVDAPAQVETKEVVEVAHVLVEVQETRNEEPLKSKELVNLESSELVRPKSVNLVKLGSSEPVKQDAVEPGNVELQETLIAASLVKPEPLEHLTVEPLETKAPAEAKEPTRDISETNRLELAKQHSTPVALTTSEFIDAPAQLETERVVESIPELAPEPMQARETRKEESWEAAQPESSGIVKSEVVEQVDVEPQERLKVESQVKAEPTEPLKVDQVKPLETNEPDKFIPETKLHDAFIVHSTPVVPITSEFVDAPEQIEEGKEPDQAQEMQQGESLNAVKPESLEPVKLETLQQLNVEPNEAVNAESSVKPEEMEALNVGSARQAPLETTELITEVSETKHLETGKPSKPTKLTTSEFVDAPESIEAMEVIESIQKPPKSTVQVHETQSKDLLENKIEKYG